ncbi:hypothetical protein AV530_015638 [Patagioenas fasciata monilis]|uniref:Uncharacterized protein n=1 Tax=Patagioenas fasciata monilis TaxID=372326 RepID=A0A1V4KI83_PATFA|nr:hypothetical protein AV530_015638 [Patagioenas fasciata monilis]
MFFSSKVLCGGKGKASANYSGHRRQLLLPACLRLWGESQENGPYFASKQITVKLLEGNLLSSLPELEGRRVLIVHLFL